MHDGPLLALRATLPAPPQARLTYVQPCNQAVPALALMPQPTITAVGVADHLEVMVAAVVIAVAVMMVAAGPIAAFVARHPSTKMLALAFLVMIGMALVADGLHYHIERGFIYAAMVFGGGFTQSFDRFARARR